MQKRAVQGSAGQWGPPRSDRLLPWVKVKPTKGRWRPAKAGLWLGGWASDTRMSLSSTSKLDVSVGEETWVSGDPALTPLPPRVCMEPWIE